MRVSGIRSLCFRQELRNPGRWLLELLCAQGPPVGEDGGSGTPVPGSLLQRVRWKEHPGLPLKFHCRSVSQATPAGHTARKRSPGLGQGSRAEQRWAGCSPGA